MSKDKDYSVLTKVSTWLEDLNFTYRGTPIGQEDAALMRHLLGLQYALGHDLLPSSQLRHYESWIRSTRIIDVFSFGKFLGDLDTKIKNYFSYFENSVEDHPEMDLPSFKRSAVELRGYWGFVAPIYPHLERFLSNPTGPDLRVIIQWLNFIRRANLRSLDLTSEMELEYIAFESEMTGWEYSEPLMKDLNAIIKGWFPLFREFTDFCPKHGPGSVAGVKGRPTILHKYAALEVDPLLLYLQKYVGPVSKYLPFVPDVCLERISEIVCVPKSMITNRTISKEPIGLQFFQQGVMQCIMGDVHRHWKLSRCISFSDQSLSAEMARQGSIWGEYATIDLSSASDSVSYDIVKRVFRGTWILPFLVATRSNETMLPSGKILPLKKFAPMGSAVCFPIETIIFAACCELATRRNGGLSKYRVFGDDIVIPERHVAELLSILEACHFKVNKTKSFWGTQLLNFREACGGEYFNGYEVTPVRVSRGYKLHSWFTTSDADGISSVVSFANQAFDAGFFQLRRELNLYLKERMSESLYSQLVYSSNGHQGIKTFPDGVTNYRLKARFNTATYQKEVLGYVPTSVSLSDSCSSCCQYDTHRESCEYIRYVEWTRLRSNRSLDVPLASERLSVCPASSVMKRNWVPTDYL